MAVTLVARLRMRTLPEVSERSGLLEPLLPKGSELYVLHGPVAASGYEWYEVAPIDVRLTGLAGEPATVVTESLGWVAAASRSGDAWLTPGSATCPPLPSDFRTLFGSTEGMRLACLGGIPVTVPARLVESNCDSDPALEYDPAWFGSWQGAPMLVDRTDPSAGPGCLHLLLAPGARHPNLSPSTASCR